MLEYKTLYEISIMLNSEQDIHALIRLAVDKVVESTKAQRGVLLVEGDDSNFIFECARNKNKTDIKKPDSEISTTVIQSVLSSGESQIQGNALNNPELSVSSSIRDLNLLSIACSPLQAEKKTFGVIYIDNRSLASLFDENTKLLLDELSRIVSVPLMNSLNRQQLLEEQQNLKKQLDEHKGYDRIVGSSPAIAKLMNLIDQVAESTATVLVTGESGTGKELVARQLHQKSSRNNRELILLDCSTISESLMESELFGHVKGAFTGADRTKSGWFEIADKGTIFLDEIGEMSMAAQKKLLRLVQFGEFTPVGSRETKKVDVRLVTATNRDLQKMVSEDTFRQDLYYRINVFNLQVPPLRERIEDIMEIAQYFLCQFAQETKKQITEFSQAAKNILTTYPYPGNIRELRNIIHYATILCNSNSIDSEHLPILKEISSSSYSSGNENFKNAKQSTMDQFEIAFISDRLKNSSGNITKAAEIAGMYKKNFIDKMKQHSLNANDFKNK
jgi:transcriptional regulator with GAF, ATPase, and Fis domain